MPHLAPEGSDRYLSSASSRHADAGCRYKDAGVIRYQFRSSQLPEVQGHSVLPTEKENVSRTEPLGARIKVPTPAIEAIAGSLMSLTCVPDYGKPKTRSMDELHNKNLSGWE